MNEYQNFKMTVPTIGFGDVVVIKRNTDNLIERIKIYYANKVKIEYAPGLTGAYTQSASKMICTADIPKKHDGIIAASEFSPFGKNIIGKK